MVIGKYHSIAYNVCRLTCSPLSPGIPGIPRGPIIAAPEGPRSPYKTFHTNLHLHTTDFDLDFPMITKSDSKEQN